MKVLNLFIRLYIFGYKDFEKAVTEQPWNPFGTVIFSRNSLVAPPEHKDHYVAAMYRLRNTDIIAEQPISAFGTLISLRKSHVVPLEH